MIEYNQRIDEQISDALRRAGRVPADGLPGLDDVTGAALLRQYVEIHRAEAPLTFDGRVLTWVTQPAGPPAQVGEGVAGATRREPLRPSPVDQVLEPSPGTSLLDSVPVGPAVNRAYWLLPLSLGLLGGAIGWFVVRDENPRAARSLLVAGAVVQVLTVLLGIALGGLTAGLVSGARPSAGASVWPASESGRPTFHYFGTPT